MEEKIKVRICNPDQDGKQVVKIDGQCFHNPIDLDIFTKYLKSSHETKGLVATRNGRIVGYSLFQIGDFTCGHQTTIIDRMAVKASMRRKGIGTILMQETVLASPYPRCSHVTTEVHRDNKRGHLFMESLPGWKKLISETDTSPEWILYMTPIAPSKEDLTPLDDLEKGAVYEFQFVNERVYARLLDIKYRRGEGAVLSLQVHPTAQRVSTLYSSAITIKPLEKGLLEDGQQD